MLILALDTSSSSGSVALVKGDTVIAERSSANVGTHSEWLMPSIDAMMKDSGVAVSEIEVIAISYGPGSFTGLRIGVSIAKGIAWTLGVKIIGVSTLQALACNLMENDRLVEAGMVAVPLLDARRGEVYSALYSMTSEPPTALFDDSALTIDALLDEIAERGLEDKALFLGDGLKVYAARILQNMAPEQVAAPELWRVNAALVAKCAQMEVSEAGEFASVGVEPIDFIPFYLRKSEAEIRLKGPRKGF